MNDILEVPPSVKGGIRGCQKYVASGMGEDSSFFMK
jgi:hypothetical protein